mmetsp:Transcript_42779/g.93047  ORF Transcript_42779/g.93047 Transcript_42779/m.93047 type:complete len:201 (-) Transcript_42779:633-1235(-)
MSQDHIAGILTTEVYPVLVDRKGLWGGAQSTRHFTTTATSKQEAARGAHCHLGAPRRRCRRFGRLRPQRCRGRGRRRRVSRVARVSRSAGLLLTGSTGAEILTQGVTIARDTTHRVAIVRNAAVHEDQIAIRQGLPKGARELRFLVANQQLYGGLCAHGAHQFQGLNLSKKSAKTIPLRRCSKLIHLLRRLSFHPSGGQL